MDDTSSTRTSTRTSTRIWRTYDMMHFTAQVYDGLRHGSLSRTFLSLSPDQIHVMGHLLAGYAEKEEEEEKAERGKEAERGYADGR